VEDVDKLVSYWPTNLKCRGAVIITSRRSDLPQLSEQFSSILVEDLDPDDGAEAIFRYLQRSPHDEAERTTARQISEAVGGLPLTLKAIGGHLNSLTLMPLADFLASINQGSRFWQTELGNSREQSLRTVFDLILCKLDDKPRLLLYLLAFCNPDGVPREFLHTDEQDPALIFLKPNHKAE
jgi:hypothetical protein